MVHPLGTHSAEQRPELEHGRVLYLERDEALRSSLSRQLGLRGLGVDTAASRAEALQLLRDNGYQVIVADLSEPDSEELSLMAELRAWQPDASFVITTGCDSASAAPAGPPEDVACHLRKPWTEQQLDHAIGTAREDYRARRASHIAPSTARRYAVLLIEDDAADAELLLEQLARAGVCSEIKHCQTLAHATSLLRGREFDAVLLDIGLAGFDGRGSFEQLKNAAPEVAVIVISSHEHEADNVLAVRRGAQDYLVKNHTDVELVRRTLQHSIERKHQERKLAYLAHHDPLTQLVNRAAFSEKLEAAVIDTRRADGCCAVMCLDLDGFKLVNDGHGQEAGDAVLCEVARRIQASVREEDTVARLGGDEFGVLLRQVEDAQVCVRVAQRILDITSMPVLLRDDVAVELRASLGIAVYPEAGVSADVLLRAADAAMYTAKAKGGGYLLHSSDRGTDPAAEHAQRAG